MRSLPLRSLGSLSMRSLPLRSIWQIVSEINLAEIQREIESPFHLLIAADEEVDAAHAARLLSAPGSDFVHPWITVTDSAGSGLRSQSTEIAPCFSFAQDAPPHHPRRAPDCATLVSAHLELSPDLAALLQALNAQSIPCMVVVVGSEGGRPGGALARPGEQARVAVTEWSDQAVARVAAALVDFFPAPLRLPLARRLPPLRAAAFNALIEETSKVNAGYSFTTGLGETVPGVGFALAAGDAIVLTKNQLMMAYKIALVAGKTGSPQQLLGEIVGVLGGGFLFRQIARQMVGLIPGWGIMPKVAIAYAGTWVIGRAVAAWATEGQKITPALMKGFYRDALSQGQRAARKIVDNTARRRLPDSASAPTALARKPPAPSNLLRRIRRSVSRLPPRSD